MELIKLKLAPPMELVLSDLCPASCSTSLPVGELSLSFSSLTKIIFKVQAVTVELLYLEQVSGCPHFRGGFCTIKYTLGLRGVCILRGLIRGVPLYYTDYSGKGVWKHFT